MLKLSTKQNLPSSGLRKPSPFTSPALHSMSQDIETAVPPSHEEDLQTWTPRPKVPRPRPKSRPLYLKTQSKTVLLPWLIQTGLSLAQPCRQVTQVSSGISGGERGHSQRVRSNLGSVGKLAWAFKESVRESVAEQVKGATL